jgi:hypothetical protein
VGIWRRLHDKKLHNLLASPNIFRVIKSRRMRWLGQIINAYRILVEKLMGRDHLKGLGIDGRIILEWILGT